MTKYNTGQVYKAKIRVCGTRSSFEIMEGDLIKDIGESCNCHDSLTASRTMIHLKSEKKFYFSGYRIDTCLVLTEDVEEFVEIEKESRLNRVIYD